MLSLIFRLDKNRNTSLLSKRARLLISLVIAATPFVSIADQHEKNGEWTGELNFGADMVSGNSDTRSYSLTGDATRRTEIDRWAFEGSYYFAEERDFQTGQFESSEDRTRLDGQYDYFLTNQTYILGLLSLERDKLESLDRRTTIGVGIGHYFIEELNLAYSAEIGTSYVNEQYETPPNDNYTAARVSHDFQYKFTADYSFSHTLEVLFSLDYSEDLIAYSVNELTAAMTESILLKLRWEIDWQKTPFPGDESTDQRVKLQFGWAF